MQPRNIISRKLDHNFKTTTMKKIMILVSAFALSGTMFAQKPSSDVKYSLEGNINYDATNGISWTAPNVRARYFVNDNIAARVQLGLGSTSDKTLYYEGGTATGTGFNTDKTSGWSAQLGAEYHLGGTEKMSPYFMGALNFGGGSTSSKGENNDGTDFLADVSYEGKTSNSSFGLGIGAGMDYYIAENMYLGLELGWGWSTITDKGGKFTYTTAGTPVDTEIDPTGSSSGMGTGAMNTAFRIGWRF